jgi:uncharacterized protein
MTKDVIRVHDDPGAIEAATWNGLLMMQSEPTPFMRHEYLSALHRSGSAVAKTGWQPQFITLEHNGELTGACALYLKAHSYGEYVFDWAWAEAYQRHGLAYYPKLLGAAPFTPVPGARLLARDAASRSVLVKAIQALAQEQALSSAHVLFMSEPDRQAFDQAGWMLRENVQFHWCNREKDGEPQPYADFADFLASLQRDKRKKIAQERRRVAEAGVHFQLKQGADITPADWDFFYRCYTPSPTEPTTAHPTSRAISSSRWCKRWPRTG